MRGAATRAVLFDADRLAQRLRQLRQPDDAPLPRLVVAWSGGADSTALLAALCELRDRHTREQPFLLRAVHVDHGLQPAARAWGRHCHRIARQLRVPLAVRRLRIERARGESPEAAARDARYAALEATLRPGEQLLLAQHARDQLETLLLQLLRGSGARGLAAMPARRRLGAGWLLRPLLDVDPQALRIYLQRRGLPWVEDPSNAGTDPDRNYLRVEVLPRLAARWPALLQTTGRSVLLLREAEGVVGGLARRDLACVADGPDLSLPLLRRLPAARVAEVLRAWLVRERAPLPDQARLAQMLALLTLREDAQPEIRWSGCELRRHQDRLILIQAGAAARSVAPSLTWRWSTRRSLQLPGGRLRIVADPHGDVDLAQLPRSLLVSTRSAGRARAVGGRSVDVKSLLRESGVPSWQRDDLPFLHECGTDCADASLLAIADLWLADRMHATRESRRRGRIVWQRT